MVTGFDDQDGLFQLLPGVYRQADQAGLLRVFLRGSGDLAAELERAMAALPQRVDLAHCPAGLLPLLAGLLDVSLDASLTVAEQRRWLAGAVARYRRRGTLPALRRDLTERGWRGRLRETWRVTLRLNRRAGLGAMRLAGPRFNQGVLEVVNFRPEVVLAEPLREHQPAGTRVFFEQWFQSRAVAAPVFNGGWRLLTRVLPARPHSAWPLNRRRLNDDGVLTRRRSVRETMLVTTHAMTTAEPRWAVTFLNHLEGRRAGLSLNRSMLNGVERLDWLAGDGPLQRRLCRIAVSPPNSSRSLVLAGLGSLHQNRLSQAEPCCRLLFRRERRLSLSGAAAPRSGHRLTISRFSRSQAGSGFRLGHGGLNQNERLNGALLNAGRLDVAVVSSGEMDPRAAVSRLDRRRGREPGFSLNQRPLNHHPLSRTPVDSTRASLSIACETTRPPRPARLNSAELNHTRLNQAGNVRLGWGTLNRRPLARAEANGTWLFRQKTRTGLQTGEARFAANQFCAARWPEPARP